MKKIKFERSKDALLFLEKISKNIKNEATRKSSQNTLEFFNKKIENLIGGSADLTGSNLTKISSSNLHGKNINYIHYGVREHLMSGAMEWFENCSWRIYSLWRNIFSFLRLL